MVHILRDDTAEILSERKMYAQVGAIRKMTRAVAYGYIADMFPFLTPEQRDDLLCMAEGTTATHIQNMPKGKTYAILWAAGATWAQIAGLFGITRATAKSLSDAHISPSLRSHLMPARSKCNVNLSHEEVSKIKTILDDLTARDYNFVRTSSVHDVAAQVLRLFQVLPEMQDDDIAGEDPLFAKPSVPPTSGASSINWDELLAGPDMSASD